MALTLKDRFDEKYIPEPNTGCWLWTGYADPVGYGRIRDDGPKLAHRVSWELHNGPIPEGGGHHGVCVLHSCDQPFCVNPDHLFLGSNADNQADKAKKGRAVCGSKISLSKLTESDVSEIKRLLSEGWKQIDCANLFGVSDSTVWCIKENRTWRHVPWL